MSISSPRPALHAYFDSCYDAKKQYISMPMTWVNVFFRVGADSFIQAFNEWIDLRRVPLPQSSLTVSECIAEFDKLRRLDVLNKLERRKWVHYFPFDFSTAFPG